MNYIKDIHSSGVHLLSLINDILDFSKAEAGKLELHLTELDATKLIKNCMRLVSPRAEQAKVELLTEVPREHFVITGDAKKLKQVLLNLLSNAVKFTPENGEVKVTAWQNVMDDSISIEVKDTGIGIAPKDISRAMSPFGQVDSALSRKYEGTGLGLPLTKKFVEIMGGTFRIESELNVGTTITITIPLTPPRHVLKAAAKAHSDSAAPEEKQISPRLMEHAQQASANSLLAGSNTPAVNVPQPARSLLSEAAEPQPTTMPEAEKITLIRQEPASPANREAMSSSPAKPELQPVRSLIAGKSLPPLPETDMAVADTPTELQMQPSAPVSFEAPPSPIMPPENAAPSLNEEPAPAESESGTTQKFMSYADLKRMAQQQAGKSSTDSNDE